MDRKLNAILLDIISLSYFKYRLFTFLFIIIFLFLVPINFLESLPNLSICHIILGEYCYSVGITRGLASLLKGNLEQAIEYNFRSIPVFIILTGFIFHDFLKFIKR
jgi:hypothetical protein